MDTTMRNTLIFGDSYSTFEGYIPEGYAVYYTTQVVEKTDVHRVEDTWWYPLCEEKQLNLIQNNSWSGSTVGYTGYGGRDCSGDASFLFRLEKLIADGFFTTNKIDTVLLFGGTNDSWSQAPLGEIQLSDWKREDLFFVRPAICRMIARLREILPDATILCIANTEIKPQIREAIDVAAKAFHCTPVLLSYLDKRNGHPTVRGMADIREQVAKHL